jgi:ABC-type amino acid transport substrate-binding protein/beta-lactamase regulating signal transducer with metallopeptidase domain
MSLGLNETLYHALLETSFRAAILAAMVALLLAIVRVRSSRALHAAWTAVLVVMLLMPVLQYLLPPISIPIPFTVTALPMGFKAPGAAPARAILPKGEVLPDSNRAAMQGSSFVPVRDQRPKWPPAAITLYCVGVFFFLSRALLGLRATSRIACECKPVALEAFIHPTLRIVKTPVYESETVAAPLTIGIISPRIILPVAWRKWRPEKLDAILIHEFSHVRRQDTLFALLSNLNRCLFWFHPLAWWLERKLASTAELACDDEALGVVREKKLYAEVLLEMAAAVRRHGGRLTWEGIGIHGNGFLSRRIDRILRGGLSCEVSRIRKTVIMFGCAAAIFFAGACHQKRQMSGPSQETRQGPSKSFWTKRLRILANPVHAPFVFGSGTGVQGLDVDIGNEIGKDLGLEVVWVKSPEPGNEYALLKKESGTEILLSAAVIDPYKSADFEYSTPYCGTGDIIAHLRNRSDITDLASLSGKKVGVVAGRPGDAFMARQNAAAGATVIKYSTVDDAMGALNLSEIDAVVGDAPLIAYSIQTSFHNSTFLPVLVNRYKYAAVVPKGKTNLLTKINATINRLKSTGELKRLDETWFGSRTKGKINLHQNVPEGEKHVKPASII